MVFKEARNIEAELDEAVRHIRALEQQVQQQQQQIDLLVKKLEGI